MRWTRRPIDKLVPVALAMAGGWIGPAGIRRALADSLGPLRRGTVVALRGTPHLWIVDEAGALHWAGDTRALAGKVVDWGDRREVTVDDLRRAPLGTPWLSLGLLKLGEAIYLPKWETDEAIPTLFHVQSVSDLELFGLSGANYGELVYDQARWEATYGIAVADLPRAELAPAAQTAPPGQIAPPASWVPADGEVRSAVRSGIRVSVLAAFRGYQLPRPYDSWTSVDTELLVLAVLVENLRSPATSFARRDFRLLANHRGAASRFPVGVTDDLAEPLPWASLELREGGAVGEFPPGRSVSGLITFPFQRELSLGFLALLVAGADSPIVNLVGYPTGRLGADGPLPS